jgi:hypothetical protein
MAGRGSGFRRAFDEPSYDSAKLSARLRRSGVVCVDGASISAPIDRNDGRFVTDASRTRHSFRSHASVMPYEAARRSSRSISARGDRQLQPADGLDTVLDEFPGTDKKIWREYENYFEGKLEGIMRR